MALQVWLPLTKNLSNQGLNNMTFSIDANSNIILDNNGKIGACYSRSTKQTSGRIVSNSTINLSEDISMACWALVSDCVGDTANGLISNHSHANNTGVGITVKQISTSDYRISCNTGTGSNRTFNTYYGTTNIKGAWHHLALTYAKSAKQLILYVDGNAEYTLNNYVNSSIADYIIIFDWSTTYNSTSYRPAAKLNDVRIYDHCLSPKEVKEISKGLVLHYPLNDAYVDGTTNLVTSITKGGQTTVNGYEVTTSGISKDTYFTLNLSEKIIAGNTYTISCRNNFDTGLYWDFPIGSQANQTLTWRITPGYSSYTFVANSGNSYWDKNTCFMDDLSGTARNAGKSFKMWDWQIEKKDHATPFVIGTRNETIVHDCSGYQNNGTASGNITLSVDSTRYIGSYKFIPNAMISTSGIVNFDKCTYSVWCKDPNMSYKIVFCDGTSKVAFGESSGFLCSCGSNSQNKFTKNNWKNSDWNHVVVVRDGSTYKMYINGKTEIQSGTADYWNHSASTITVGGREENAAMWNGNISDFRIYSTALSADDIKELYNTSAYVLDNGTLLTYNLEE